MESELDEMASIHENFLDAFSYDYSLIDTWKRARPLFANPPVDVAGDEIYPEHEKDSHDS